MLMSWFSFKFTFLIDFYNSIFRFILQGFLKKILCYILQEGFGIRVKGIHILTPSKAVELLVKLFNQFVSEKVASRIHVHKTLEELYDHVSQELLPCDYGGNQKSFEKLSCKYIFVCKIISMFNDFNLKNFFNYLF